MPAQDVGGEGFVAFDIRVECGRGATVGRQSTELDGVGDEHHVVVRP